MNFFKGFTQNSDILKNAFQLSENDILEVFMYFEIISFHFL